MLTDGFVIQKLFKEQVCWNYFVMGDGFPVMSAFVLSHMRERSWGEYVKCLFPRNAGMLGRRLRREIYIGREKGLTDVSLSCSAVNDPAYIPKPHPSHGSYHWTFERCAFYFHIHFRISDAWTNLHDNLESSLLA